MVFHNTESNRDKKKNILEYGACHTGQESQASLDKSHFENHN